MTVSRITDRSAKNRGLNNCRKYYLGTSLLRVLLIFVFLNAAHAEQSITIKYLGQNPTKSKKILQFEHDLYRHLLAQAPDGLTVNLQAKSLPTSSNRTRMELAQGNKINVMISPIFADDKYKAHMVPVPVLRGLLGYRKIISRRELEPKLSEVKNVEDLRAFTIGQVNGWKDIGIYEANDFNVETSVNIETLFAMLSRQRFDILPLGVIEIEQEHDKFRSTLKNLYIDNSILFYYPIPLLFHVNVNEPQIAGFLQISMEKLIDDGTLDRLIEKHFNDAINVIRQHPNPVFVLKNPAPLNIIDKYKPQLVNPTH